MNKKIYIATHKLFFPPKDDNYIPIIVGNNNIDIKNSVKDNTGDNISNLNPYFCEMTALYWIWKNSEINNDDVVGMVHYRRYFSRNGKTPISDSYISEIMQKYDVILPRKRNYIITTIKDHYINAHHEKDLQSLYKIVEEMYPDYKITLNKVFDGRKLSLYNMFITRGYIFKEYCSWVFPILFELNIKINREGYDSYQSRVIGFLAERLFNVWFEFNRENYKIKFENVYNSEGENKLYKGIGLIRRQLLKGR